MRKICVITGNRSEYGLLQHLMEVIKDDDELTLQLIVTGAHLSPLFGSTYHEIELDGFVINEKVDLLISLDTQINMAQSMSIGLAGISEALNKLKPDLVIILGDRYEIFVAAIAAVVLKIPIAHLHGGESTEGSMDEIFRHSITKMANLHFVAAKEYQAKVLQLGENPEFVFLVGGLGVDAIKRRKILSRKELEEKLGIQFQPKILLVCFHAVTAGNQNSTNQFD